MKHFHLLLILLLPFIVACGAPPPGTGPLGFIVFKGGIQLEADTNKATTERVITLTARYNPQVSGTGRLMFRGWSGPGGDTILVLEPVADTLYRTSKADASWKSHEIILPLNFTENETGVVEWKVRLLQYGDYAFSAFIFLDSIYIADSARMYALDSDGDYDVIEKYYPLGLENVDSTPFLNLLTY